MPLCVGARIWNILLRVDRLTKRRNNLRCGNLANAISKHEDGNDVTATKNNMTTRPLSPLPEVILSNFTTAHVLPSQRALVGLLNLFTC